MRLHPNEIEKIKKTILHHIRDATIILFGSRVDDDKRGGDIDLLVETGQTITLRDKLKILTDLELNGIVRKVDLLIKSPQTHERTIIKSAREEGIVL